MHVTPALRHEAKSWSDYASKLSANAEEAGVLVMRSSVVGHATKKKVSKKEFQGFAIADSLAPLVFVNSDDFKSAQIFTLAHELAHIWIGASAISNPDPVDVAKNLPASVNKTELFCNRVAAEVLVPEAEFLT